MFNLFSLHCVAAAINPPLMCRAWHSVCCIVKVFATIFLLKSRTEVYTSVQTMFKCAELITTGIVTEQRSDADISDALATVA